MCGSPLSHIDLDRAKVRFASAVFLMSHSTATPHESDTMTVLYAMALRNAQPDAPLIIQTRQSLSAEPALLEVCDRIFCTNEFKLRLLGRNCIAPGVIPLMANLIRSYPTPSLPPNSPLWRMEYGS